MTYLRGLVAAICALALLAPAASAVTVNVRVEGANGTIFEGPVDTGPRTITAPDDGDPPTTAERPCNYRDNANGGAGDTYATATTAVYDAMRQSGQDFEAIWYESFKDFSISKLGGETQDPLYWGYAVDRQEGQVGGCQFRVDDGDDVLWALDMFGRPLLELRGPNNVRAGEVVTYTVVDGRNGAPVGGATVGGRVTDGDGRVELRFAEAGDQRLKAEAPGAIRSNAIVLDVDPADAAAAPLTPGAAPGTPGGPALVLDRTPPRATVASMKRGQVFSRTRAPKLLKGRVAENAGVLMVKLRITRTDRGRCSAYSGKRERFIRRPKCGADSGWWFKIGSEPDWEYQLASKLPRGRYVLDVNVIDRAYNRDDVRRPGENRVVFHVR